MQASQIFLRYGMLFRGTPSNPTEQCRRYRLQDNVLPDNLTVAALQVASREENDPEVRADLFGNIVLAGNVGESPSPLPYSLPQTLSKLCMNYATKLMR